MKVDGTFKYNPENFKKIYQEEYKSRITHGFIRSELGLSECIKLKLNGTFERWLYLLDKNDNVFKVEYRVQTALWINPETGKKNYVSIFPNFIKRYCQPSLHLLEYISCHTRKGEDVLRHIDDPEGLFSCEDRFVIAIKRIEIDTFNLNYSALLNSRYVEVFNRPISVIKNHVEMLRRFKSMFTLVETARQYFGQHLGVLAQVNTLILL
ncbi:MAG: hypothetical protein P9M03_12970 [Candidatus Theseobacter exili]|nr:hypothetical protein [Candidatus Theseobacter exili]